MKRLFKWHSNQLDHYYKNKVEPITIDHYKRTEA